MYVTSSLSSCSYAKIVINAWRTICLMGSAQKNIGLRADTRASSVDESKSLTMICLVCASDIGWVVGHSFIVYAPLLVGATTILFEGKPVGTPDSSTFWRVIHEHEVNILFTAPTALRAIRRDDPRNEHFEAFGRAGGLRSLRGLFLAGERSEPGIVKLYEQLLEKWGPPGARVIDNWWSSESGSPISGVALRPLEGIIADMKENTQTIMNIPKIKAGAAGKPMPGFDVRVVDDEGNEVPRETMGNIVLGIPLAPSGFVTLFKDEERFYEGYMKRFGGKWVDTGDAGMIDEEGYVHVMSRSDDIINVAAHRFSTGEFSSFMNIPRESRSQSRYPKRAPEHPP